MRGNSPVLRTRRGSVRAIRTRCEPRRHYLSTFRAVAKKYPRKPAEQILADLVKSTSGEEGKWFAAAKEFGLYDAAIELARASPCDPKTLARAARDYAAERPAFAVDAGYAALVWLVRGIGYEITGADVWMAYSATMKAALGRAAETKERIRRLAGDRYSLSTQALARGLGLDADDVRRGPPTSVDVREE